MDIEKFADMINECKNIVFFGGAGVSTESGVKDYRSKDGLYNTVKDYGVPPETILSIDFFEEHPDIFYDFYRTYFTSDVEPNKAHKALAELEKMGKLKAVITQNIDGLHQKAGSKNVIELHGTTKKFYCHSCNKNLEFEGVMDEIKSERVPKCKYCGGLAKPKVVLYGEMLYDGVAELAIEYIANADMLIVGGTSLAVQPAASFVRYFRGKYIVIINKTATDFDNNADLVFRESIGTVFEKVMRNL
ncbi:MAG: NAD-dependent protein deacylase [Clostridiales bacterium]|nr:NAD-dependent protein deacylase [Clostridiales bacterium]